MSCDNPADIETWAPNLLLRESCVLPDAPAEVLDLLPPDMTASLPLLRANPQVQSYRQNLFAVRPL